MNTFDGNWSIKELERFKQKLLMLRKVKLKHVIQKADGQKPFKI